MIMLCVIIEKFKCKTCGSTEYRVVDLDAKNPTICCDACGNVINNDEYDIEIIPIEDD
jgi:uncharacterized Zn finger protein